MILYSVTKATYTKKREVGYILHTLTLTKSRYSYKGKTIDMPLKIIGLVWT